MDKANGETVALFSLYAEHKLPLVGDSRHEVITAVGTYEYANNGINFTARDGEQRYFSHDKWRIEITPLSGGTEATDGY